VTDSTVTTTGETFTAANICVQRVREGRIVSSRDFHDHVTLAAALGRLDAAIAARASQQP
jgi:ketosteroid isomerase-like protein